MRVRAWVLVALALLLLPAAPAAARAALEIPPEVSAWFDEQGPEMIQGPGAQVLPLSTEELADVEVGRPVAVTTWSPELLEGTSLEPALTGLGRWVAPVTLPRPEPEPAPTGETPAPDDAPAGPVPVAVLHARMTEEGTVTLDHVADDTELAQVLLDRAGGALVHDEQTEGWFGYQDGTVAPLTEAAQAVLAGPAPLEVYQPFLVERYQPAPPGGAPAPGETDAPEQGVPAPVWAAVVVLGLLAVAATVVWLRRPEADAEHVVAGDRLP